MRNALFALLFSSTALITVCALAQTTAPPPAAPATPAASASAQASGPADLCQELLAYAEKKAAEPPKPPAGQASPAAAPPLRPDGPATGTQGGGTIGPTTSTETRSQEAAPPTAPVSTGAAPEPAVSPHATSGGDFKLSGGTTLQQVRDTAKSGDRQACRDMAQKIRRAGADMPAALIALAAYEPDPAKRQ